MEIANSTNVEHRNAPFAGPYIVLGIAPHWPAELERRKAFKGPHSSLLNLLPFTTPPQVIEIPPEPEEVREKVREEGLEKTSEDAQTEARLEIHKVPAATPAVSMPLFPIGGKNSALVLKSRLSRRFLDKLGVLVAHLDRPKTAKQAARLAGVSKPTLYAMLELMRRRGFPLRIGRVGRAFTYQLVPAKTA
jgi:hypothetical protein